MTPSTMVIATPSGPLLSGSRTPALPNHPELYVRLLSNRQRIVLGVLTAGWVGAFVAFWHWWLQPEHNVGWPGLIINSVLLFYLSYLPIYFMVAIQRLRQINSHLPVADLRVAFVVTKAPSEPWALARSTLEAMLAQEYPHSYDVWLCDEDPTNETVEWCAKNHVRLSTRRGIAEYHRAAWPRRTKCKEGNLAYFYDNWGYRDYDAVAQLDCDHAPSPTYLAEVIRPFADPSVGYVAAPSMCDTNARTSWAARGRLHKEGSFHGPFQAGHVRGLAPMCIGSHYAVRTEALQSIGGLGPELAEDFSTAFLLNSAGWQGAFAIHAEAHGEGPPTFAAKATQEFQWARSLMVLLVYQLTYYPLLALTTLAGLCLLATAAVTGIPWVNVNYFEFLLRWSAVGVWLLLITYCTRRWGLLRPNNTPLVSWEGWLYVLARWPFVLRGVIAAVRQKIRPNIVTFRVTPKSRNRLEPLPTGLVLPYAAISGAMSAAALIGQATTAAYGYVFLCLLAGAAYTIVALAVPLLHAWECPRPAGTRFGDAVLATVRGPLVLAVATGAPLVIAVANFPEYLQRFLPG
jgi:cellulose synthase (UDP-forming)